MQRLCLCLCFSLLCLCLLCLCLCFVDPITLFTYLYIYIYIYIYRFVELDYLVEDIYCYSEFHAPSGAIIRQLPKLTDTKEI